MSTISRSLKTINDEIKACDASFKSASKSAKELSKALTLDPSNAKLIAQRMKELGLQVDACKNKIKLLKEAQEAMIARNGEIAKTSDQYQKLDIEIEKTRVQMEALEREMEKAAKASTNVGEVGSTALRKIQTVSGGVSKAIGNMVKTATTLVTTLIKIGTSYAETADEIAKASKKYGMSAEEYQIQSNRWQQLTGDAGAYASVLQSLSAINANAELESSRLGAVLERLGLTFDDLKGMSQTEALEIYLEALRECESETERTALATKLFGTSIGPWMAEMAMAGQDAIAEWDKWLEEAGYLTDEQVAKGEKLNDTFEQLRQAIRTAVADAGEQLIPVFQNMVQIAKNLIPLISGIANALAAIGPTGTIVLGVIAAMCSAIPPLVVMLAALNASAKQYVAAFTSLAILGTVAAIGLTALAAGGSYSNEGADSYQLQNASNTLAEEGGLVNGSDAVTNNYESTTNDNSRTIYIEDNSTNNYNIDNEMDVDEVIEKIGDARRGMIGG